MLERDVGFCDVVGSSFVCSCEESVFDASDCSPWDTEFFEESAVFIDEPVEDEPVDGAPVFDDVPEEVDDDVPDDDELSDVSANAVAEFDATAAPTPNATASAPTRPM